METPVTRAPSSPHHVARYVAESLVALLVVGTVVGVGVGFVLTKVMDLLLHLV